ncbi:hypothetical protein CIB48_g6594 [Xylaria polymorpha]|nr:hypothetical protein CIB48_g6594 [Xylaria polymorpha]
MQARATARAQAQAKAQDWGNQGAEGQDKTGKARKASQVGTRLLENGGLREDGPHSFHLCSNFQVPRSGWRFGGSVGVLLYQFQLQGTRSSGWIAPRSRSRRSTLGAAPGPVPVPVSVPGDAAGCRRQDMGVPPTTGLGLVMAMGDGGRKSASRNCGGSVAAEADGTDGRWEDLFRNTKRSEAQRSAR